ncbi:MAG: ClpXP protease specificity-enhancing factor SspB [Phaeospirillum sp.]|nr:ClpXP protease specificity-enhancing factor SspB [Phaeospirillum sp.]
MPVEELRYDKMVEDALRGVVRDALAFAAEQGLPGDHHFYVTFRTHYPGVALPKHVLARHPDEMTIVLQHQYWDLEVGQDLFSVTLSFSGKSERLVIPFAAVSGFADPSAKFGLQFQAIPGDDEDEVDEGFEDAAAALPPASPDAKPEVEGDGKVVTLDRFRKK